MLPWLFFLACLQNLPDSDEPVVTLTVPEIETISWACDVDKAQWTLEVRATSWTDGGRLYLTEDGEYVENHRVKSVAAGDDGSFDRLKMNLSLASDWRKVNPGSSTAFSCASDPFALFHLLDDDGRTDCTELGPEHGPWDGVDGVKACD
jgi:hypothetical protein